MRSISAVSPLILRELIDVGILKHKADLVIILALIAGGIGHLRSRHVAGAAPGLGLHRRRFDL